MISFFEQKPFQQAETLPSWLSRHAAYSVRRFHETLPAYSITPLHSLATLATQTGVQEILIKDESYRFGLNAFKALGGSYAMACILAERFGISVEELTFQRLQTEFIRRQTEKMTFVTATDGNHGYGVAWTAAQLGAKSVIYMPQGSSQARLQRIQALGAQAEIVAMNYDDAVRLAAQRAVEFGWEVVQDTAWPNYEKVPQWIMQGYTTLALEAWEQAKEKLPTHLFIQAGVGSLAGAVIGFFSGVDPQKRPVCVVVEPHAANCCYASVTAGDGLCHKVEGDLQTIMAGLACGEVNPIAWPILQNFGDWFFSIPDEWAEEAMARLAYPEAGDPSIVSGESGAAGFALVWQLLSHPEHAYLREKLQLNHESRILCINSEGDTDPASYLKGIEKYKGRFVK
jgi:diaminopropionate ammonia-lyase